MYRFRSIGELISLEDHVPRVQLWPSNPSARMDDEPSIALLAFFPNSTYTRSRLPHLGMFTHGPSRAVLAQTGTCLCLPVNHLRRRNDLPRLQWWAHGYYEIPFHLRVDLGCYGYYFLIKINLIY